MTNGNLTAILHPAVYLGDLLIYWTKFLVEVNGEQSGKGIQESRKVLESNREQAFKFWDVLYQDISSSCDGFKMIFFM